MRVASLLPSATEMVHFAGAGDTLVGVTHECDYPPGVEELPQTHEQQDQRPLHDQRRDRRRHRRHPVPTRTASTPSTRASSQSSPPTSSSPRASARSAPSPRAWSRGRSLAWGKSPRSSRSTRPRSATSSMTPSGSAKPSAAATRQSGGSPPLEERLARVEEAVAGLPRPRVGCIEWLDPPFSAGHWVPEMVRLAGGEELFAGPGERSVRLDWERSSRPPLRSSSSCPAASTRSGPPRRPAYFPGFPDGPTFRRLRDGRVWVVDANSYFSRPAPRLVEGVEILARILHPEAFADAADRGDAARCAPVTS